MQTAYWLIFFILILAPGIVAHNEEVGDPAHDQNEEHIPSVETYDGPNTPQYTAQKEVANWEEAWPYVLLLFLGLGGFAFTMGMVLQPTSSRTRRR